jgi:2-C-methyl-D-erythritol 4-phosphate cytidylyltransferase
MWQQRRIGALLLMAGSGNRFGDSIPKQFLILGDLPVYVHALRALENLSLFDDIILVCHPGWIESVAQERPHLRIIPGGSTRQESSYCGLMALSTHPPDIVCIHDAVRPFVSHRLLMHSIQQADLYGAVDPCIPSTDTIVYAPQGELISSIPIRKDYWRGQTPQTFRYSLIWNAHKRARAEGISHASDDCQLILRHGSPVYRIEGDEENIKITTPLDFMLAQALLAASLIKSPLTCPKYTERGSKVGL